MDFGHYNDAAVTAAVDLVNSLGSDTGVEGLPDPDALREFMSTHRFENLPEIDDDDVARVHEVRARLRTVFECRDDRAAGRILNAILQETDATPRITDHDGALHIHYVPDDAPAHMRMAADCTMGLVVIVCEHGWDRLGICANDPCRDVFVDTSRNRSRRYCSDTCANRANVAAYRARIKQGG